MTQQSAFHQLHHTIKEELYLMKWATLRPIQEDAIHAIFGSDSHIIISAMTAGGKTEAAFLPILSNIVNDHNDSIRALYIGPLKALINDQFRRLEDLCERTEIPVHKWHGDVGQSAKHRVLSSPGGVLLITPESVESLFVNHADKLDKLFSNLSYIVIDELHAFMGNERGAHLRSLISRLMQRVTKSIRIIGLSATLGDMEAAKCWVDWSNPDDVVLIESDDSDKVIKYLIKGYLRFKTGQEHGEASTKEDSVEEIATEDDFRLAHDLINTFSNKTALIFSNNKKQLELYADLTGRILLRAGQPNPFRIHHGSLSKAEREDTEEALRSSRPTATFCSSTLELGIDVGNVSATGQIGAPWSVSSLKQRLGRSGRKYGDPSIMWIYIVEDVVSELSNPINQLFPQLLRAIAMTELMLEEWCEPPDIDHWHLSTLIQQAMSVIAESGGTTPSSLYNLLIAKGAFNNIDKTIFIRMLRSMADADLIEQTLEGIIILGLKGERIVRSFEFYSAFVSQKEFRVVNRGHLIGTIIPLPTMEENGFLILAGRRWKILEINSENDEILVESSRGGRLHTFSGGSGPDLHPKIHEKMREILLDDTMPLYLDTTAKIMLNDARSFARKSEILQFPFFINGKEIIWFTWAGTRINRSLVSLGLNEGLKVSSYDFALSFEDTNDIDIHNCYNKFIKDTPDPVELAKQFHIQTIEKYDEYLSDDLLNEAFAHNYLSIPSAVKYLHEHLC